MNATEPVDLQQRMQQLDTMLEELTDPILREKTGAIIQGLMEFHAEAIAHTLDVIAEVDSRLIDKLAEDDLVANLLLLYNLHPQDLETRVRTALESVRPYLASHGGNVELTEIMEDGAVHLEMQGSCHSCPSSSATLKNVIEKAIYERAPDVSEITIADVTQKQPEGFVPIELLVKGHSHALPKESA